MKFEKQFILDLYEQFHQYYLKEIKEESEWFVQDFTSFMANGYQITIKPNDGLYDIDFCSNFSFDLQKLFNVINKNEYSEFIRSLKLGYEVGAANGTLDIDLQNLLRDGAIFPNLETFNTQLESRDTNMVVISQNDIFDENGVCGYLLDSMPNAKKMVLLNSPSLNFFERSFHPIETLLVKTIYENNNFIKNLANAKCFPNLENLCFFDYDSNFNGMENEKLKTPFDSFLELMNSTTLPKLKVLNLLNLSLSNEEIEILKKQPLMNQLDIVLFKKQLFKMEYSSEEAQSDKYWFYLNKL